MARRTLVACSVAAAISAAAWTVAAQPKREGHPALERAIDQISNIKGRLQQAPKDFGGHKQKAIDALNLATTELRQAIQYDK